MPIITSYALEQSGFSKDKFLIFRVCFWDQKTKGNLLKDYVWCHKMTQKILYINSRAIRTDTKLNLLTKINLVILFKKD